MSTIDEQATGVSHQTLDFVHLHTHSEYSLLDGSIRIESLLDKVSAMGHSAVAMTDHGNLFGAIEFYLKAKKKGVKPIIGAEIFVTGNEATRFFTKSIEDQKPPQAFHLVLLCKDLQGYKNLIKIISEGYLNPKDDEIPLVDCAVLAKYHQGLIAMTSCLRGEFGYLVSELRKFSPQGALPYESADPELALCLEAIKETVRGMSELFPGDYYVELIDNNLVAQKKALPDLIQTACHFNLPLVATCDAHYLNDEEREAHSVLLGIKHSLKLSDIRNRLRDSRFHLLNQEEMEKVYGKWPEALANTLEIADKCNVEFTFGKYFLPEFDTGTDETGAEALARFSKEMLEERFVTLRKVYGDELTPEREQVYWKRLDYEIDVISNMGFPGYFLIVQDFINWAKKQNIPVGPGRGSGAGSLVAYALRITDLDPLPYNLIFERFLNPDRVSMPDFDVDFCQDRRDEVIRYVTEKYGSALVAQITTFGKMNAKAVIRDVGRVLEMGYGRVDRIAKLIPDELGISLQEAIEKEPRITQEAARDDRVAKLLELCRKLEGLNRHTSVHAAGIIIADEPLTNHVPVYKDDKGLITQFEMKMAEKVGLVKFDFLGLKTLTVIQQAVEYIRAQKDPQFDIDLIPMDDRKVFDLISAGKSVGIFQLESHGMRQLIMKLKPSCFEDIIAVVALFRPGPLGSGMVDDFIERKHGRQEIEYPHDLLEDTLKETYGVILYQEQVMKIAVTMANYSLGESDLLRRAMGKKIAEEMEKQKVRFISGAIENKIPEAKAAEIFDLMAEFAKYGFNKSHSAAYGLVSYQTAFLKAHYPEQFMAAIMTCDLDNTKKIVRYVDEVLRMGMKILPPDINRSLLEFDVPKDNTIGFGLAAIKGIGGAPLAPIVEARKDGAFRSFTDLARRVNLARVGKKNLELLAQVGAFSPWGFSRDKVCQIIPEVVKFSDLHHNAADQGQMGLFDGGESEDQKDEAEELTWELSDHDKITEAKNPQWLKKEKNLLGVYLTGHPMIHYKADQELFGNAVTKELYRKKGQETFTLVAVLIMLNERITKSGSRMASLRLEDQFGTVETVMFESDLPEEWPEADTPVVCHGTVAQRYGSDEVSFRLQRIEPLEDVRMEHVKSATLELESSQPEKFSAGLHKLKDSIKTHRGDTNFHLAIKYPKSRIVLNTDVDVHLSNEFLGDLRMLPLKQPQVSFELFPSAKRQKPQIPGNESGPKA